MKGDLLNNASYSDNNLAGQGLILNGTAIQSISGTGNFARLTLNNAAGATAESNITLHGRPYNDSWYFGY